MVALPGFINLHNHVSMSLMRSYADDMPLMPWLNDKIWPFEAKLNGEDIYLGAKLGIAEMLLGGTTTFVDMYWHSDRVADAVSEMGTVGGVSHLVGANYDNFEPEAIRMAEKYGSKKGRIQIMLAPHAAYTCPPDTLKKALKIADRYGLGIQIHVSETLDEQRMIREQYGKTPWHTCGMLGCSSVPCWLPTACMLMKPIWRLWRVAGSLWPTIRKAI